MPFIPHTADEEAEMLAAIGVDSIDDLYDEIPAALRVAGLAGVPAGLGEAEVTRLMRRRAGDTVATTCFLGAGAYEHHIPAAVWEIATRGEFYSAYTPYQAEASQGTLQLIYEYQSMMAGLTALDVSNASLYDGATAFAEACLVAIRGNRRASSRRILVPRYLNPLWRRVADAILGGQGVEFVELPATNGRTDIAALAGIDGRDFAALCIPFPNFLGGLEPVDELTDWAHARGTLVVAACNPTALALLKPPGSWGESGGADIACGEGQPLGIPLAGGGPYFGFLVCRKALARQMPGRIVGGTVDMQGRAGFTLTLQAREQHIRRSKATSNICTNQGLMVTAATIYMSLLGPEGLRRVALACHGATRALTQALTSEPTVKLMFEPFFHEAVLQLDRPVAPVLDQLAARGILGGYDLARDFPELGNALLVCATECRTADDIAAYASALREILGAAAAGQQRRTSG
jgi:glycine dehydrogenase subunit 1